MITNMISVTELQRNYTRHIAKANKTGEPLLVLKNNRPEAVILGHLAFAKLADKANLREEKRILRAVYEYEKAKKAGKLIKMKSVSELFD